MKITPLFRLLFFLFLSVITVGFLMVYFLRVPAGHSVVKPASEKIGISTTERMTDVSTSIGKKASDQTVEFFKVITDPLTGQYAVVDSNKEIVTLKDKIGKTIWVTNIIQRINDPHYIFIGESLRDKRIGAMKLERNLLLVIIGKEHFSVDIFTGDTTDMGAD